MLNPDKVCSVSYPEAGHGIAFPYLRDYDQPIFHAVGGFWCTAGGNPDANAIASKEGLRVVIHFLKRHSVI